MQEQPNSSMASYERSAPLESLFKANPIRAWRNIPRQFGDDFMSLDGVTRFQRGRGVRRKYRLPALLDDRQCVVGDLIPPTSWGSSLANLLTKTSWDKIRHPILDSVNRVCSVCGIQHKTLDIHEQWAYYFPKEEMESLGTLAEGMVVFGIQRLEGFHAVCASCHRCFHLGLANVRGELDDVKQILKAVNQWSDDELSRYISVINDRCRYADQIHWALDLSYVAHHELAVKSPWRFGEPGTQLLLGETRMGSNLTLILNAQWSFASKGCEERGPHFLAESRFIAGDFRSGSGRDS